MEELSEERVREIAARQGKVATTEEEVSATAAELLDLRAGAHEAALAKVEAAGLRDEMALQMLGAKELIDDAHRERDAARRMLAAEAEIVVALIELLDQEDIPLGEEIWAKLHAPERNGARG